MTKSEYRAYLASDHWRDVKRRYRASRLRQTCFCGATRVDLHHRTYKRIGRERLGDLVPLCREHHAEVHRRVAGAVNRSKVNLWNTPRKLAKRNRRRLRKRRA